MYLCRWFLMQSQPLQCCCRPAAQLCPTLCNPMDCARQASVSFTIFWSFLKLMSIESVMPSSHLILCRPLLLPSTFFSRRKKKSQSNPLKNRSLKCLLKIYEKWSAQSSKLFILINHSPTPYPTPPPPAFLRIHSSLCIQLTVFLRQDFSNYSAPC